MGESEIITIPARSGKAARLIAGQSVKVINTHGEQVVDAWAFNAEDLSEFMSMEHWRPTVLRIIPEVGDAVARRVLSHRKPFDRLRLANHVSSSMAARRRSIYGPPISGRLANRQSRIYARKDSSVFPVVANLGLNGRTRTMTAF